MIRYGKIYLKFVALDLSSELRYKLNIVMKFISLITMDFIGPLIAILIYSSTQGLGIPGWSFYEFLLFQGTLTLTLGLGHAFAFRFAWEVMDMVRHGEFDRIMVKPLKPLTYLFLGSFDFPGCAEIMAGLVIIIIALLNLKLGATMYFIPYVIFILLGYLFQLSVGILIASIAFLFIQSWALFDVWRHLTNFARYPSIIFSLTIRFVISFIFPVAIASYYPAATLLGRLSTIEMILPMIAVVIFFIVSLIFWKFAMKKYSSAGG